MIAYIHNMLAGKERFATLTYFGSIFFFFRMNKKRRGAQGCNEPLLFLELARVLILVLPDLKPGLKAGSPT